MNLIRCNTLTLMELVILACIVTSLTNHGKSPTQAALARTAGVCEKTVSRVIRNLENKNFLKVKRGPKGTPNTYSVPHQIVIEKRELKPIWGPKRQRTLWDGCVVESTDKMSCDKTANLNDFNCENNELKPCTDKLSPLEEDKYINRSSSSRKRETECPYPQGQHVALTPNEYTDNEAQEILSRWIKTFGVKPPDAPFYELVLAADWMLYLYEKGEISPHDPLRYIYHLALKDHRLKTREFPKWTERKKRAQERTRRIAQAREEEARQFEQELKWRSLWADEKPEIREYYLQKAREDAQIQRLGAGDQVIAYHLWKKEKLQISPFTYPHRESPVLWTGSTST